MGRRRPAVNTNSAFIWPADGTPSRSAVSCWKRAKPRSCSTWTCCKKHVLEPVFGIEDPRTNQRIQFVGGIRGTAELEKLVGSGEFACAFSMFPLGVETLMAISDAGGVMPPKSTWFEPKLRDGMFCHLI